VALFRTLETLILRVDRLRRIAFAGSLILGVLFVLFFALFLALFFALSLVVAMSFLLAARRLSV
jgi:hypothetical protein